MLLPMTVEAGCARACDPNLCIARTVSEQCERMGMDASKSALGALRPVQHRMQPGLGDLPNGLLASVARQLGQKDLGRRAAPASCAAARTAV